ncbi:protoglobin domain-containing protein [Magnetofaba australis]|uniref:Putative methyl-accepting chemotaxis sensory transducer n=1 Tax=Magnetofaba australis IT-1 TaxID=1434232 RepID=A0A1Y2JZ84_9PROT|nr:protoglobin domain-containing protein [Magnetofaba australis]OSM00215.1 putative methyl-accepting chemotaxis sensory transducer [Magnetofaba australis IT-1]
MSGFSHPDAAHPQPHSSESVTPRISAEDLERRKRFVGFTSADAEALRAMRKLVEKHAEQIVDLFYERIGAFGEVNQLIAASGSNVDRLKTVQRQYLLELFGGDYGMDYFLRRWRIGLIHNKVGLDPQWYLGGYSLYRQLLTPIVLKKWGDKPKKAAAMLAALDKILALDSELAMGSYIDCMVADLQSLNVSKTEIEDQVTNLSAFINSVAQGDLSQRLELMTKGHDDLGRLGGNMNAMVDQLAGITRGITDTSEAIVGSLEKVRRAVADQSSGAAQQAAAVNETTSTLEEIRATSNQTLEKATSMGASAEQTRNAADRGLKLVEENINGMQSIRSKVEAIAETILALSKKTQQIGEITNVVAGLAQHSKMLALNASIEAAKAGDSGKGFAVVASEVKDLAEQSEESTTQVQRILMEIQHATDRAVMVTEEGAKGMDQGMSLMERMGEVVRELQEVVHQSARSSQQIVAAVRQEAVGIDQVSTAMGEINQVTGQFVTATDRTSEASNELNLLAEQLRNMARRFKS